jgi:hypothetical protein
MSCSFSFRLAVIACPDNDPLRAAVVEQGELLAVGPNGFHSNGPANDVPVSASWPVNTTTRPDLLFAIRSQLPEMFATDWPHPGIDTITASNGAQSLITVLLAPAA